MTIESPPLYTQGGTYPARLDRFVLAELWDEGVRTPTACKVTQRGAGANFTVDVAVGSFLIAGDDQSLQGTYQGRITATQNATIGAAPSGSNKRIDLVTLRVNDPNAGGNSGDSVTVVVVAGTQTTGTPAAPALPASSIPLATVGPLTSSTASVTNSIITDARLLAGRKCAPGTMELQAGGAFTNFIPNGWLSCDGSAVSRTSFADLFAMIGTVYGVGDGSTTFNLPDLRTRVPVAFGSGFTTVGATGGEVNHTLSIGEMPSHDHGGTTGGQGAGHTHTFSGTTGTESATHTHAPASGGWFLTGTSGSAQFVDPGAQPAGWNPISTDNTTGNESASHTHTYSGTTAGTSNDHAHGISAQGGGGAHNNMQPYQVVSGWAIRT